MSASFGYSRFDDVSMGGLSDSDRAPQNDPELDRICGKISEDVTRIKSNVSSIEKSMQLLGTPREPPSLRAQLSSTQQQTSMLIKTVSEQFRVANDRRQTTLDRNAQFRFDRLQSDFRTLVQTFQKLQRDVLEKHKAVQGAGPGSAGAQSGYGATEGQRLETGVTINISSGPRQVSAQLAREDELVVVQQREAEMAQLEQDMVAVHEIFKDLSSMVYDQGQVIDTIEVNVESAASNVDQGQEQLASAVQHKRSYRRNCCILWAIVAVVVIIIVIVLVTQLT